MNIALIVPENQILSETKMEIYKWEDMWEYKARKKLWSVPNLGLLTVAGMLPDDFFVEYIDLNYVQKSNPLCDWVFMSPSTCQAERAYRIAGELRASGIKVAMGGVHVSVLPDEALQHADTVFIGEAEGAIEAFIADMKAGAAKPTYRGCSSPSLVQTPIPRYDLTACYPYNSIPVQTSRGCPHQCSFCVSSKLYGKRIRRKSITQIQKELENILSVHKRPLIFFTDDNIFVDNEYGLRLIRMIKKFNIRWYAFSDAGIAFKDDLLQEISESGCLQLLIGFESLEEENLAQINRSRWKRDKLNEYEYVIAKIQGFGVGVVGSFVLGMDIDTSEYFDKLYSFIIKTNIYATNITVLTPFPGTAVYSDLKRQNRIFADNWSKYNGFELNFQPEKMSVDAFEKEYIKLYKRINCSERRKRVSHYFIDIYKEKRKFCD